MRMQLRTLFVVVSTIASCLTGWHYYRSSVYPAERLRELGVSVIGPPDCIEWHRAGNSIVYQGRVKTGDLHSSEVVDVDIRTSRYRAEYLELLSEFKNLQSITVRFSEIPDEFVEAIAEFEHLRLIDVSDTDFDDDDLMKLTRLPQSSNLLCILVEDTKVTSEAADRFRKLRPNVRVIFYMH